MGGCRFFLFNHAEENAILKARKVGKTAKLGHGRVFNHPISRIKPSPENDKLYKPIDPGDPAIIALAASIRRFGVKSAIKITLDDYIVDGHRRYAAAKLAGLIKVPCLRELIKRADPEFLELLTEYNRQRVKSIDEQMREEIVSGDEGEDYQSLIKYRRAKARMLSSSSSIQIYGIKTRCEITPAKQPMLDAIRQVIEERRDYWPLSDRSIHYALLNVCPLKHAKKPDSTYGNDKASYKDLTNLLTRARLQKLISMEAISDETRPFIKWKVHREPGPFIQQQIDEFFQGYWRDVMQSQPCHIEIVGEKNTVGGILRPIAMKYRILMTTGRGYCSLRPRYDMQQRFLKSGKEKLVVLMLTDFDPDGEEIAHSFIRSMRDDFSIPNVEGVKVALTGQQVTDFQLPPMMQAKEGSANFTKFTSKHGQDVFELEAIPPGTLQKLLSDRIDSVIDRTIFNRELDAEKSDRKKLTALRQRIRTTLLAEAGLKS